MSDETALLNFVEDFGKRIASLTPLKRFRYSVSEMRQKPMKWDANWSDHHGVYYCVQGNEGVVAYVGKSSPGYLGTRIWNLINPAWSKVPEIILDDPLTAVGMIVFDDNDWYWALALEALLIHELKPQFCSQLKG